MRRTALVLLALASSVGFTYACTSDDGTRTPTDEEDSGSAAPDSGAATDSGGQVDTGSTPDTGTPEGGGGVGKAYMAECMTIGEPGDCQAGLSCRSYPNYMGGKNLCSKSCTGDGTPTDCPAPSRGCGGGGDGGGSGTRFCRSP